jgi:hypothetical protein
MNGTSCQQIEFRSDRTIEAICQQMQCQTVSNDLCIFPFKFVGRSYDTCITLSHPSKEAWCSTKLFQGEHIGKSLTSCQQDCPVTDCPLGYYRAGVDYTCYRVKTSFFNYHICSTHV